MKRVMLFLFFLSMYSYGQPIPVVSVNHAGSAAPNVDGVVADSCWLQAPALLLTGCQNEGAPDQATTVKVLWNETHLFVAMIAEDSDIWCTITTHDGALYSEDVLEAFIDPDGDSQNYFEFEFNALNAGYDSRMTAPFASSGQSVLSYTATGLDYQVLAQGTINNQADQDVRVVFEAAFAWTDFDAYSTQAMPPLPGDTLRMNLYRIDGRSDPHEYSCLSPVMTSSGAFFHTPARFAKLVFSEPETSVNKKPSRIKPGKKTKAVPETGYDIRGRLLGPATASRGISIIPPGHLSFMYR